MKWRKLFFVLSVYVLSLVFPLTFFSEVSYIITETELNNLKEQLKNSKMELLIMKSDLKELQNYQIAEATILESYSKQIEDLQNLNESMEKKLTESIMSYEKQIMNLTQLQDKEKKELENLLIDVKEFKELLIAAKEELKILKKNRTIEIIISGFIGVGIGIILSKIIK